MKKNILIVSVEFEIGFCIELAKKIIKQGNNPIILIADSWSIVYAKKEMDEIISKNNNIEIVSINNLLKDFNKLPYKNLREDIDWIYLDSIQNKFINTYTLQDLMRCDVGLLDDYHDYGHFNYKPNNLILYKYLEICSKYVEQLLDNYNIDLAFSYNNQGLFKSLIYAHLSHLNKAYYCFCEARINDYFLLHENFGLGISSSIKSEMLLLKEQNSYCIDANQYIKNYVNNPIPPYLAHNEYLDRLNNTKRKLFTIFKNSVIWSIYRGMFINFNKIKLRKVNYFLPTYYSNIKHYFLTYLRINSYLKSKELNYNFNESDLIKLKYVYFPLHRMPENSVSVTSKILYEDSLIFDIARILPPSWLILVKLPPGMITMEGDTRKTSWYKKISKIPNVLFVSPFLSSKALIKNSQFVASIAGTALLEASYFNKYGLTWGKPEFCEIKSCINFIDIQNIIIENDFVVKNNDVKYYVQACINHGFKFNRSLILNLFSYSKNFKDFKEKNEIDATLNKIVEKLA